MKYGVLFLTLAIVIAVSATQSIGWQLLLLWPALSFGIVGLGYLLCGESVFGKRADGTMAFISVVALWPYLLLIWGVWHVFRMVSQEARFDQLVDHVFIGRRLLPSELPTGIATVVDLTAEFPGHPVARTVENYIAAPMLDASTLTPPKLAELAWEIAKAKPPVLVHCAQGHGRTGLIAALVLIALGKAEDGESALNLVRSARPGVRLNHSQRNSLNEASALIASPCKLV